MPGNEEENGTYVPHDRLTPGLWYIRTSYPPHYTVVSLMRFAFGPNEGEIGVWTIDDEGNGWIEDYGPKQFIRPVPPPFGN